MRYNLRVGSARSRTGKMEPKMTQVIYKWQGITFETEVEKLPPTSLAYLIQYGWNQTLQDAMAGPRNKAVKDGEDEDTIKAVCEAAMQKRMAAILAGEMSVTQGGGRDPIKSTAKAMLETKARALGKKLPSDAKKLALLVDNWLAKDENLQAVKDEIARRKADKEKGEVSLEDF